MKSRHDYRTRECTRHVMPPTRNCRSTQPPACRAAWAAGHAPGEAADLTAVSQLVHQDGCQVVLLTEPRGNSVQLWTNQARDTRMRTLIDRGLLRAEELRPHAGRMDYDAPHVQRPFQPRPGARRRHAACEGSGAGRYPA